MQTFTRRDFLKTTLQSGLALTGLGLLETGPLFAAEPIKRTGAPRLLLSLAAYSFREYFEFSNNKLNANSDPARRISLFQFIDYCADHECQGTELTSYYFPPDITPDLLTKIKQHAFLRGIAISGTAVGNTFTVPNGAGRDQEIANVKRWVDH